MTPSSRTRRRCSTNASASATRRCRSRSIRRAIVRWRKQAIAAHRTGDEDFAHAVALIRATRAVEDTLARARHYGQRAIDALGGFAGGPAKDAMVEAVEFAVARAY